MVNTPTNHIATSEGPPASTVSPPRVLHKTPLHILGSELPGDGEIQGADIAQEDNSADVTQEDDADATQDDSPDVTQEDGFTIIGQEDDSALRRPRPLVRRVTVPYRRQAESLTDIGEVSQPAKFSAEFP